MVDAAPFTFAPLTPTAFLDRSAAVFGDHIAVVDGDRRFSYAQLHDRSRRLAGALAAAGAGARVAVLAPNSALSLEAHNGVPWAGAVLVPEWSRMSPISSALSRVLSGTSTAPAHGTPLWASSDSALLGASTATRAPAPAPAAASAPANRRDRSCNCA